MLGNLILEMTNAPGTAADCLLTGPTSGRLPFSFAFGSGASCFYVLADGTQSEWGIGTYTAGSPNKLTRTTVLKNSAGSTARLNFLGSTRVYNDVPAERFLWIDNSNNVNVTTANIIAASFQASKSGGALLTLQDPAAASDAKYFDFLSSGGTLTGRAVNDLYNAANNWLSVTRSGYAVATISLAGTNINLTGALTITGAVGMSSSLNVTGSIASSADVSATGALRLSGGSYHFMDANFSLWAMDGNLWRWQYQRSSGRMSYVRGGDNAELFVVDGSGNASLPIGTFSANGNITSNANITANAKLMCAPGDNGVSPNSGGSYLTLSGTTSTAGGANLVINGGGRTLYSFEYYWGATRIGGFDTSGNLLNGAGYYVNYNAIGQNFAIYGDGGGRAIQFQSDGWKLVWTPTDGSLVYYNNAGFPLIWSDGAGNFNARGSVTPNNTSDIRTKRDIQPYQRGLADLIRLRPVSFQWNGLGGTLDDGKRRYGLVAQDVEPIAPECVYLSPAPPHDPYVEDLPDERLPGQLSLDDGPLRFAFINALRELSEQNTALAARVAALEARAAP